MLPFQIERIRTAPFVSSSPRGFPLQNGRMEPMLATAVQVLPHGPDWTYEFKWDGVRALYDSTASGVRMYSRRGNEITVAYPELAAADLGDVLLDGEVVAFVDGRPSFEALQSRMHVRSRAEARRLAERIPVTFVVFDLLRRDGIDLTVLPHAKRRAGLEQWAVDSGDRFTLSPSFDDGAATESVARQSGLEGVVAKRRDARYRPGGRTRDWQKLRFVRNGDFAVIGWEAPVESPDTLSSLVLAMWRDGGLVFAGKAGSGLTGRTAAALQKRLQRRADRPVAEVPPPSPGRVTRWVDPDVVVEIEFTLWTDEGRLRHPVFHRIRDDKTIEEATGDG
jgi:bifunctional non-homologous end joining protein LigD